MNVELLERVKAHILEEPNRLIMGTVIATDKRDFKDALDGYNHETGIVEVTPPCGTAACIAGWTCILGHPEIKPSEIQYNFGIATEATRLLDIPNIGALYYTNNWPEPFRTDFKTTDLKKRAEVAAARIDHFIETGE